MACPHTMKATDRDGTVFCCDCGKVTRRALSTKVAEACQSPKPPRSTRLSSALPASAGRD